MRDPRVLRIHPHDNVLVALQDLKAGEHIVHDGKTYVLVDDVAAKHKFFTEDLSAGDAVRMYGVLVGRAVRDVKVGQWMNTTNVRHAAEPYSYRPSTHQGSPPGVSGCEERTVMGYHRGDGRVGTASFGVFIPTVFCENRNLDVIREALHH